MSNIFNRPTKRKLRKSNFDLGFDLKTTMEMGYINPISVDDVLPGDTWRVVQRQHLRLAPQLAPFMHRLKICSYAFGVPKRLLFDGWEEFITGGERGDTKILLLPFVTPKQILHALDPNNTATDERVRQIFGPGSIWDYMGLPPIYRKVDALASNESINWLPFRAYHLIWFEYFRDQNVISSDILKPKTTAEVTDDEIITIFTGGRNDRYIGSYSRPYSKAWERDYFTAGLPWPQRGPEVHIPGNFKASKIVPDGTIPTFRDVEGGEVYGNVSSIPLGEGKGSALFDESGEEMLWRNTGMQADISGQLGTINELRVANRLQTWLERAARSGGRLTEHLLGHWGEFNKDSRLQRPEWLGSSCEHFVGEAVLQTSFSNDESAQANPAGNSESRGLGLRWKRHFTEDCFVITLMSILPTTTYQDGIPRMYSKLERFDHAFPDFAHLGEQAIKRKELFASWYDNLGDQDFSYVPRYSEYKYAPSRVTGDFRTSLNFWHMGRIFYDPENPQQSGPFFNRQFVEAFPSKRIFPSQVAGDDVVWTHIAFERKVTRKLPKWPTPKL